MRQSITYLLGLLIFNSCVRYHYTKEGGIRVNNPKVFKYNKPRFTQKDKSLIDINAIYILDSEYSQWNDIKYSRKNKEFVRFFSTGQILFTHCNGMPRIEVINNQNLGTQGYFIVKGDKIKIDLFSEDNGGCTQNYYGKILDSDNIMFYEVTPVPPFFSSFKGLEKGGRKSFWKKVKVAKIINYIPDW
jgi:hypothetical protein